MPNVKPERPIASLLIGLLILGLLPEKALAHRVTIFAWAEGPTVHTQSHFPRGKAVQHGRISVFNSTGALLLTGTTDSEGNFDFKRPNAGSLRIVLDTGDGHGNEWVLAAQDEPKAQAQIEKKRPLPSPNSTVASSLPATGLSREEIKVIVDESIDNKLKPIMKMLTDIHDDTPSLSDILGGIGYILGLIGIGAYIHSRKRR